MVAMQSAPEIQRKPPIYFQGHGKNKADQLLTFYQIPKCASTALTLYLTQTAGAQQVNPSPAHKTGPRWAVLRHPVNRMASAYLNLWQNKGIDNGPTWEQWWAHVRDNADGPRFDLHTMPMVDFLTDGLTHANVLEEIDYWWPTVVERWPWAFRSRPPERRNATKVEKRVNLAISTTTRREITEVYAEDLKLWREYTRF